MTRQEKAVACTVAIVPVTAAGIALLRCGCVFVGWAIEITTAAAYFAWIARRQP
jgi:hypothetical protein